MLPKDFEVLWAERGFFTSHALFGRSQCDALLTRSWELVSPGASDSPVVTRYERELPESDRPERRISKLHRLHRTEAAFRHCLDSSPVSDVLQFTIGPDVDLFLSQIVFKLPGTLGQPWHQDASAFPFEPPGPVVGIWWALTEATSPSSQLGVKPGSHKSGQQPHGRHIAQPTRGRYVSLLDQSVTNQELLELGPGDADFFDSALVHASTDNLSHVPRVAATAHFASAGTIDHTEGAFGSDPFNDWMPWLREGRLIPL